MTDQELEQLKYPIGTFDCPTTISASTIDAWISILEHFPNRLEQLVSDFTDKQLDTPYRPEGWTVRQVVHHVADSHHNSYTRFKWAMTEDNPIIKAYNEQDWAKQHDYSQPIDASLYHIKAVHAKLVYFVKGLNLEQLHRTFIHPEGNETVALTENLGIYAWHCNHHYAHIEELAKREGWI
ncbi:YfiT family bacillithiol transferase [Olleya sp. YS]|uniref:YfiT family bacillithiol transferase n=1 Tax=Olleya sp. YS TaxID=3028318 RepID=UPI002434383E|nr:putative metal-dependent hydrolase [Olleya sp. YS]WGD34847.1 putative metal-dependent hydrolase [Olleya sp. YS]